MITTPPLVIDELGQLAGLLLRYKNELEFAKSDGLPLDASDQLIAERQFKFDCVDKCLRVVSDDLYYRLKH